MAILVLDLDLTVFVNKTETQSIDKFHQLSPTFTGKMEDIVAKYQLRLINPDKLKVLIETAYTEHDGVIILTAGLWDKSIVQAIATQLELNNEIHTKFITCAFINPFTCKSLQQFNHLTIKEIQALPKGQRIAAHIQECDFSTTKQLVLLDDTVMHVNSFTLDLNGQGTGVIAQTSKASDDFYETVKKELQRAKARENTPTFWEPNKKSDLRRRNTSTNQTTESRISTMEPHRTIYYTPKSTSESICDFCCTFM